MRRCLRAVSSRAIWAALALTTLLLFAACTTPTEAPAVPISEPTAIPPEKPAVPTETVEAATATIAAVTGPVIFTTEDGISLAGTMYGGGDTVTLLVNMQGASQDTWQPFAETVAEAGYAAFTFDYRGLGKSEGKADDLAVGEDATAAIGYLHNQGFREIVLIGASLGGIAVARHSHAADVAGLALVSTPRGFQEMVITDGDLVYIGYPKLFVVSEDDEPFATDIPAMYALASPPKDLKVFSGSAHGTFLFDGEHKAEFEELLLDLIREAAKDS